MANFKSIQRKTTSIKLHPDAFCQLSKLQKNMAEYRVQTKPSVARAVEYAVAFAELLESNPEAVKNPKVLPSGGVDVVGTVLFYRGKIV